MMLISLTDSAQWHIYSVAEIEIAAFEGGAAPPLQVLQVVTGLIWLLQVCVYIYTYRALQ